MCPGGASTHCNTVLYQQRLARGDQTSLPQSLHLKTGISIIHQFGKVGISSGAKQSSTYGERCCCKAVTRGQAMAAALALEVSHDSSAKPNVERLFPCTRWSTGKDMM